MTLIKTSLLNVIAVGIRMLTLLGINKILAIYVGPAGYAALGQFQNAVQMISTLASGAINTGVTKYTAEYHDNEAEQRKVWQTAGTIALTGSLVLSVLVFIFRERLALGFLGDAQLSTVFVWFAATLVLLVFNTLLLAILNGKKDIPRYVLANIAGSVLALAITALMVVNWGLLGALIALAVYQSLAFFATLFLCLKTPWFRWRELVGRVYWPVAKNLAKYTAMALTTAATVPLSHILIRNHMGQTLGWEAAGHWEAMWRLSGAYLMLVSTTLSVYYLPRLSELKTGAEIKKEILSGYRVILPAAAVCASLVYHLRDFLIVTLFSPEFRPMEVLFFWQLVGDVLKIASWLFAFAMLGKAMTLLFMFTEVIFSILFYLLALIFTPLYGIEGVSIAYALNYFIYLPVIAFLIYKKLTLV
ncbi:O-antigen translocase [Limnohabitans sp. Hippo3]|uniref:O-antigen translocase n=1 Tax=Limnohabitans sp. Hippo3 TaxID=1597956 RepID=UPI000D345795|nr:O-antigen translocase [Limnohabitans sp. Hippo3]PUE35193.1 O-antigen translocase [Limnohabitans sp. Hippo3]